MPEAVFQPFPMLPKRRAQAWQHRPEFRRPRHFHREPELNLVVRGTATLGIGTRLQRAFAMDVLVFEPGQDHVLLDASDDLELFTVALTPELAERSRNVEARSTPASRVADHARAVAALRAVADMSDAVVVDTLLSDLFYELKARSSSPSSVSRRAAEQVIAQPAVPCAELARKLGTHPSNLSRVCARELGVPLVELRSRLKLSEFVRLVDAGLSFTQAALQADFGSYAQCHRVFHVMLGCSPQEYFAGARATVDDARFGAPR